MNLETLSAWVAARFGLTPPVACHLVRSYTNDVYAVASGGERFALKVYGQGWRTESEVRYEVALLQHLCAKGLRVAAPAIRQGENGDAVQQWEDAHGLRYAVLFEYAPGAKPVPPFTPRLYEAFGQAVAQMHALSDDFTTEHRRTPLDLNYLVDEPLALALPLVAKPEDRAFLVDIAGQVKEKIILLARAGLDWGPIHGDATLDNLHITSDGEIILFDFDSGGPGWRAADLQGWAAHNAEYAPTWNAFQRGYTSVRPLNVSDLAAAPYLTLTWDIWGLKIDLDRRVLWQGREHATHYLNEQVAFLRERARAVFSAKTLRTG